MKAGQNHIIGEYVDVNEAFSSLKSRDAQLSVIKELNKRNLFQRYFNEFNIYPDDNEFSPEEILKDFLSRAGLKTGQDVSNFLRRTRQTKEMLVNSLIYNEQINRLKKKVISPQDIHDLFLRNKLKYDSVLFSIIRTRETFLARELFYRLRDDHQDFAETARRFSIGEEAKYGGIVGPVSLQNLNPELRNVLNSISEGEITEPFSIDDKTFLIVKLLRLTRVTLTPQLENSLQDELFEYWINRQLNLAQTGEDYAEIDSPASLLDLKEMDL